MADEPVDCDSNVNQRQKVDVEDCKFKILFDKLVHEVWEEIGGNVLLPIRIGEGKCVDLFRVFVAVMEKGGCVMVSECGLWNLIGERCGLGGGVGESLNGVYVKYLDVLESGLKRIAEGRNLGGGLGKCGEKTGRVWSELEEDLECLLAIVVDEKKKKKNEVGSVLNLLLNRDSRLWLIKREMKTSKYEDVNVVDSMMCTSEIMDVDSGESENADVSSLNLDCNSGTEFPNVQANSNGSKVISSMGPDDMVNKGIGVDDSITIQSSSNSEGSTSQRKRKRESMLEMLNWLIKTAKSPCDPSTGCLPERSRWKKFGNGVLWKQVLSAREKLFFKQKFDSKSDQELWLRRQMNPSMYEERMPERPRSSRNLNQGNKSQIPYVVGGSLNSGDNERKQPRIGKYYQAALPEWGSSASENDSKWLGTKIWPLEKTEKRGFYERIPVGRGRQDDCGCPKPRSVECVRFHISEKSARLKPELGSAFQYWKLNDMGDNAARNWTFEEENKFCTVVKEFHNSNELWENLHATFPARSKAAIVSYYFNVFLLRHRAHQNRHTPCHIDSDIDESESNDSSNTEISLSSIHYSPKNKKKTTTQVKSTQVIF